MDEGVSVVLQGSAMYLKTMIYAKMHVVLEIVLVPSEVLQRLEIRECNLLRANIC